MNEKAKEILEKQLELLSERSKGALDEDLESLTSAMYQIYSLISSNDFRVV